MEGINDVFVQSTNGIPFVARCYGGNYCKTQPDHALVSGFFAAINSFKGEFGQKELNNVMYNEINLLFESQDDLLVVCNIDNDIDEEAFRKIATTIQGEFIKRFGDDLSNLTIDQHKYEQFTSWMDEQIGQGMADLRPLIKSRPRGLIGWFKSLF